MKSLDIILLIPLAIGAVLGYRKGFIVTVVSLLSFAIGIFLGFKLIDAGMMFLESHFPGLGALLPVVSFLLIFILAVFLVKIVGDSLKKVVKMTVFGKLDSLMGMVAGAVKWGVGVSVLIGIMNYGHIIPPEAKEDTIVYPVLLTFSDTFMHLISEFLSKHVAK